MKIKQIVCLKQQEMKIIKCIIMVSIVGLAVFIIFSISSLCALIRKHTRVDRFDNSFILSKYFSCWNINLNLQYVRNLFSFLLVAGLRMKNTY
jgi:hypothetical protein